MSVESDRIVAARPSIWNRTRLQLGAGLLLSVLLPWLVRYRIEGGEYASLENSLFGTGVALVFGYYGFRRLARYPGVRTSYPILPSFAVSYGVVLAAFFFMRLDYSRLQFAASFALAIVWFYIVYFKARRRQRLRIGIVPFGTAPELEAIDDVHWIRLEAHRRDSEPVDAIVADLRADIPDEWERWLTDQAIEGTLVMHVKQISESLTGRVAIEHLSENNFGSLIPGIVYAKVKRAGDLLFVLIAGIPLALLCLGVAIAIRLDSPGPIFFRQQRMGQGGKPFKIYKFRSMFNRTPPAGDERSEAMTRHRDRRVTRVGRLIRRFRIDELPQVINIVRGEMSWIGPRPEAVALSLWYEAELPFYRYRHIVRPGITGWAQVNQGHVAEVDDILWKLHYDFYYIKNFSMWLDLLIVARTIRTVLTGHGAR